MKQFLTYLFVIMFLSAYGVEKDIHLEKEKVAFGKTDLLYSVWDASLLNTVDENSGTSVTIADNGLLFENERHTSQLYLLRNDTIFFRGKTCNNTIGAVADSMIVYGFKFCSIGDKTISGYQLTGSFSGVPSFEERGEIETEVMSTGRFIFAPGDTTIATLTHETRRYDIISKGDSIAAGCVDERWRWFVPGDSIPFALQIKRAEDECARLFVADAADIDLRRPEAEEELRRNIIENARISVNNSFLEVSLGNLPGTLASVYLMDVRGNTFGFLTQNLDNENNIFTINVSDMPRDTYMIAIIIEGLPAIMDKRLITL